MFPQLDEKRRAKRFEVHLPLHYAVKGSNKFGNTVTRDLSETGTGIVLEEFIPPDTGIFLELSLPANVLTTLGKVRWSQSLPHSYRYRTGIEFSEIDKSGREELNQYIQSQEL